MKHIKDYKIFESKQPLDDIVSDMKDILLELDDIGYNTGCSSFVNGEYSDNIENAMATHIYKEKIYNNDFRNAFSDDDAMKLEDVKDCINRMLKYTKDNGSYSTTLIMRDKLNHVVKTLLTRGDDILIEDEVPDWDKLNIYSIHMGCLFIKK